MLGERPDGHPYYIKQDLVLQTASIHVSRRADAYAAQRHEIDVIGIPKTCF